MKRKRPNVFYLKWILERYKEHKVMVIFMLIMTILSTAVSTVHPLLFKYVIDTLMKNLELFSDGKLEMETVINERNRLLLMILGLGIVTWMTNFYPFMRGRMNMNFEMALRKKYFRIILEKSYRFFLRFRTGDIATRLTEDLKTHSPGISWFLCSGIFRAVNSTCVIIFCLISMFVLNWKLALLSIVPLPLMILIFFKLESKVEERFSLRQRAVSETNDFLESVYSGIQIVKSFNAQKFQEKIFADSLEKRKKIEIDVVTIEGMFHIYFEFLNYLGQVVVLLFGGIMVINGSLSIGSYIAFFAYLGMIVWPIIDIPQLFVTGTQAFVTIDRLEDIKEFEYDEPDSKSGDKKIDKIEKITLDGVCFKYPGTGQTENKEDIFAIEDVCFDLHKGEKVAIVGKIGSGKTTLLNLIAGIYEPQQGKILFNDTDKSEYSKESYRQRIGFIQQLPTIFSESVYTNIDFWREAEQEWIVDSTKIAQFYDEVDQLPNKFEEKIGQKGTGLSGGQKQRLSIARAVCGRPDILLMDDVTSALDAENEVRFWDDLFTKLPEVTCLIVTHRISTAQKADRIIVLDDGKIEAVGTHDEIINSSRTYAELVEK